LMMTRDGMCPDDKLYTDMAKQMTASKVTKTRAKQVFSAAMGKGLGFAPPPSHVTPLVVEVGGDYITRMVGMLPGGEEYEVYPLMSPPEIWRVFGASHQRIRRISWEEGSGLEYLHPDIAKKDESWFKRSDDRKKQLIGYLRMDFGKSGDEFWSRWFDGEASKTYEFRLKLDEVVNSLRKDGGPLASRDAKEDFIEKDCTRFLGQRACGTVVKDEKFGFCLRLCRLCRLPRDYDAYLFCYEQSVEGTMDRLEVKLPNGRVLVAEPSDDPEKPGINIATIGVDTAWELVCYAEYDEEAGGTQISVGAFGRDYDGFAYQGDFGDARC